MSRLPMPTAIREAVLERDDWNCRAQERGLDGLCKGPLELHHILPRGRGGKHTFSNLVTLCRDHHAAVHAYPTRSYELGLLARTGAVA